jgi:ferredoxin
MVSVNIGEDPHFRRIELNTNTCTECLLCIPSCPANAFFISNEQFAYEPNLCYGCSNCLPYCNYDALSFENWNGSSPETISELIKLGASAFEIHLSPDLEAFKSFYKKLPANNKILESFSIGSGLVNAEELSEAAITIVKAVREKYQGLHPLVLQVDGIPLSGARDLYSLEQSGYKLDSEENKDLASIENARIVIEALGKAGLRDSVYVQISGGSTEHSLAKAHALGVPIAGVAIGSYARHKLNQGTSDPKTIARGLIRKSSGTIVPEALTQAK